MKINTEMIINVLDDKYTYIKDNLIKNYKDFEGSIEDFFKLEQISFSDKIFVALRLVDKNTRVKFAVKCAEHVLHIFEEKVFQDDKRIRNCIEFLNSIDDFDNLNNEQSKLLRFHRDSAYSAAVFSSKAAALASYSAAYAAADAFASHATNSDDAIDAFDFSYASAKSNNNDLNIHSTIFQFLLDLINKKRNKYEN